ncbi:hypothetical protein LELG_00086 [Lodderomyces elongisporus NRRL YB-4239]|uniref:Uncharacterized protein n=1 Tax=Lodderomyces elongisporus (strain ATCC 11503 / CBS 2605 / JCM 1781 / NBRC 1676 / NRRL YB-4239) TaxID=379508 RepID=A5DRV0_LODEL|nr:hypothetical protein LELG_00086 [Lodderomyces elongisporus NRRL YB-4239]
MNKKKHALDDDHDDYYDDDDDDKEREGERERDRSELVDRSGKRIKLDSMMKKLDLNDNNLSTAATNRTNKEYILPRVKTPFNIFKKEDNAPQTYTSSRFNSYVNDRIVKHFQEVLISGLKIIPWYNYQFLIIYIYRKWFVKLFNRFLKKYNARNGTRLQLFTNYDKIVQLIPEGFLTWNDLKNIIYEENRLEIKRLKLKNEMRQSQRNSDNIRKEAEEYKDLGYNYWDNLKFDRDLDMLDADDDDNDPIQFNSTEPKIVVLQNDTDDHDAQMMEVNAPVKVN